MSMAELRKAVKEKTLALGTDRTLKKLRKGKAKKVFLAKNCPDDIRDTIEYYSKLTKAEVINLKINNNEIGLTCKKPFRISVLCY